MQLAQRFLLVAFVLFSTCLSPALVGAQSAKDLGIGTIDTPPGVDKYQAAAQAQGADIGIIYFMSNMIKLFTVIAGIWVLFNGTLAGYYFIQSTGDASAYEKAKKPIDPQCNWTWNDRSFIYLYRTCRAYFLWRRKYIFEPKN